MPRFRCPACQGAETDLGAVDPSGWSCPGCGELWRETDGVIDGLPREARSRFSTFFDDWRTARGDAGPGDCLELPFRSGGGPLEGSWERRAVAWRYFERKVLGPLEQAAERPLQILDAGAGVGWLSYRLALRGHRPVAVDLRDDPLDGLGAARFYRSHLEQPFPLIQADMQNLPLADDQFDLTVFSASFHFAADYRRTLQEARRVMGWGGQVVILDTPVYQNFRQGEQMVDERKARFAATYGTPADSLLSMEYLDEGMLRSLAKDLSLKWTAHQPWPGWRAWFRSLADNGAARRPVLAGEWIGA